MARPKRQSRATENRKRRERLRRESRATTTIAKQEKREQERIDRALLGKQTPTKVIKVKPIRGKRATEATPTAQPREILIVSRKGQPQVFANVQPLERRSYPPESVSSTWISSYGYFFKEKIGVFTTKTGRQYKILNFDFETFEDWYYALSKGTFWNDFIRDQYTITGTL